MSARVEADEHRIRLTLHYDGSDFAGWQVQPGKRTVQGEVEAALLRLTGRSGRVIAAGRTDSGVHATGQVAGAVVPLRWQAEEVRRALNAVLPRDVWVVAARDAAPDFHARYHAVARGYTYRLGIADLSASPFARRWCWPLGQTVSLTVLNEAAAHFRGEHSFRRFAKTGQAHRGDVCRVHRAEWRTAGAFSFAFHIAANRFLHHMVRYMVGTMVDIARDRRPGSDIGALLREEEGVTTSPPAPPTGLFLTRVYYDEDDWSAEDASDEILS